MSQSRQAIVETLFILFRLGLSLLFSFILTVFKLKRAVSAGLSNVLEVLKTPVPHDKKTSVVIVGGGFFGGKLARLLEKNDDSVHVTLLDTKESFFFVPSSLRAFVKPSHNSVINISHSDYLKSSTIIAPAYVVDVTEAFVSYTPYQYPTLHPSCLDRLPYDILVIASGSHYSAPGGLEAVPLPLHSPDSQLPARPCAMRNKPISEAHSVIIIGGGLVAVELAGEVLEMRPPKRITMISSSDRLLPKCPPAASSHASQYLSARGVCVRFGEKASIDCSGSQDVVVLSSGERLQADGVYVCTGSVPNSAFCRGSALLRACLNDAGEVCVADTLQVRQAIGTAPPRAPGAPAEPLLGTPGGSLTQRMRAEAGNPDTVQRTLAVSVGSGLCTPHVTHPAVFAGGDVCSMREEKLAQAAIRQAHTAHANILAAIRGAPLQVHAPASYPVLISLGPHHAVFVYGPLVLTGLLPALMKEFVEWKETMMLYM
mmetsp:Transcript_33111/g.83209  ORF Transcript_33111/g.83209 Transcript_33111/m.83209 type:complete len:485 (-) Transcript_33111:21-1475(-)